MEKTKILSFMDLKTWQIGHDLVLAIYKVSQSFPKEEMFGLTSQLRRAAVSSTSDIAEGFSRYSAKDKVRFYFMALGSLTEAQNQLLIAKDLKYLTDIEFNNLLVATVQMHKMINGLIKSAASRS